MSEYMFYYDETEHSRVISQKAVEADNFYDNFVTCVVGWKKSDEKEIENRFRNFAENHVQRQVDGEFKSTTISQQYLTIGFSSLSSNTASFINDFLNIFDEKILIYVSAFSKIEHIINQLFSLYDNSILFDMDLAKYSVIKAINVYHPNEVISALYESPNAFIQTLSNFLRERIEADKANPCLKNKEIEQFKQLLYVLNNATNIESFDWNYDPPFIGFDMFLKEKHVKDYCLVIDKEPRTIEAAKKIGLVNVTGGDSKEQFGLQIADLLVGLIAKLMKALAKELHYESKEDALKKNLLDKKWFSLTEERLNLYKNFYRVLMSLNNAWYKLFAGCYADDVICLTKLLAFMNSFESVAKLKADLEMMPEYYNAAVVDELTNYYLKIHNKLPIIPVQIEDGERYIDERGAVRFLDVNRYPILSIDDSCTYEVLAVGIESGKPIATIMESNEPVCFILPDDLIPWVEALLWLALVGNNLLPEMVTFTKTADGLKADIQ